jgi:glucose-1-phosphate adenylyltransferase
MFFLTTHGYSPTIQLQDIYMDHVLTIVMGGGKGTRLYPLTKERAKPAVPFGGRYRLIDIPLSNSINAGFKKIYVLTQFNSASLHLHILSTYIFDSFTQGFVEILAAEQSFEDAAGWYKGTADAVRKNIHHFRDQRPSHYIILSGDQLYRMDLEDFYKKHRDSGADLTVAATPVTRDEATAFGILSTDRKCKVTEFIEKPALTVDIEHLKIPKELHPEPEQYDRGKEYLGSMGIYCFNADAMEKALDNTCSDFGHEIIPSMIREKKVNTYVFNGFWEDIGTIKSFYDTNLNLCSISPAFNFYDESMPIFTHRRDLPPSKFNYSTLYQTIAADGSIITNASISNSVIGIRTLIESGANLDGVVCMGADYYESDQDRKQNKLKGLPDIGIGRSTLIKNAIIDKNARIGDGCRIGVDSNTLEDGDFETHFIRDGIIVIPKNGVVPAGTVIR